MGRNVKAKALILKTNPVGENHRGLSMLVSGEGLLRPLAFGAQSRRSALRGSAVPFNSGLANLYHDGVKDQWRLSAFDPENVYEGLRENLDRFYTASEWAEILLKSHGSGEDSAKIYQLSEQAFSLLSSAEKDQIMRINIAFIWHYLSIEGVRPDPCCCGRCGRNLAMGNGTSAARFSPDGLLLDPDCARQQYPPVYDGARAWLLRISSDLHNALSIGLATKAADSANCWLHALLHSHLEQVLRSHTALRK